MSGDIIIHGDVIGTGIAIGHYTTATVRGADGVERSVPMQLPSRAPKFTGREAENETLMDALRPAEVVTLCGLGVLVRRRWGQEKE